MLVGRSCRTGLGPRLGCRAQRAPLRRPGRSAAGPFWDGLCRPASPSPAGPSSVCGSGPLAFSPLAASLGPAFLSLPPHIDVFLSMDGRARASLCPAPTAPRPSSRGVGRRSLAPQACTGCWGQGGEEGGRAEGPGPQRWQAVRRSYARTPEPGTTPRPGAVPQPPCLAAAAPRGRALPGHPPSLLPVAGPASPAVVHCVLIMRCAGGFFALREVACVAKACPAASRPAWKRVRQAGASPGPGSLWANADGTAPCRAPCDAATATAKAQATVWPPRALGDSAATHRGRVGQARLGVSG